MKIPKNKNAVIGTQNEQYLTQCSLMTNHLIVSFFYNLGSSCNELVLHIVYIIVIVVLLITILILIIVLRRLGSGAGKL